MNARKRALGKGLSALLDQSGIDPQPTYDVEKDLLPVGTIGKVPVDIIESNPYQPRSDFDEEALNDLAASIREQGVIQPITLRKAGNGTLQLISGERRLKASKMAGLFDIPAYIVSADESAMLEMAIVENIQRENLNPIEIALGYKQLIQNHGLTQEMLSEKLGKSRSSIANYLRLLNLPGEVQIGIRQDVITMGHAKALLAIGDAVTQLEVYHDILAQELSVRDVEEIGKNLAEKESQTAESPESDIPPRNLQKPQVHLELQRDLETLYNARIQVKQKAGGKGSLLFHFGSQEELERIYSLLKK